MHPIDELGRPLAVVLVVAMAVFLLLDGFYRWARARHRREP